MSKTETNVEGTTDVDAKKLITSLTNWQRHQWARAGYPGNQRASTSRFGKAEYNPKLILPFTKLTKSVSKG